MQALMFPLTDEEFKAKSKELAALRLEANRLVAEKDTVSREYNEQIKRLNGQIDALAKEIDAEEAMRDPTDEEAPWQGLVNRAQDRATTLRRERSKRDRTGELPDDDEEP